VKGPYNSAVGQGWVNGGVQHDHWWSHITITTVVMVCILGSLVKTGGEVEKYVGPYSTTLKTRLYQST